MSWSLGLIFHCWLDFLRTFSIAQLGIWTRENVKFEQACLWVRPFGDRKDQRSTSVIVLSLEFVFVWVVCDHTAWPSRLYSWKSLYSACWRAQVFIPRHLRTLLVFALGSIPLIKLFQVLYRVYPRSQRSPVSPQGTRTWKPVTSLRNWLPKVNSYQYFSDPSFFYSSRKSGTV